MSCISFPSFSGSSEWFIICLLYTSDAADERSSVDLGGRRIIKKKKYWNYVREVNVTKTNNDQNTDTNIHKQNSNINE